MGYALTSTGWRMIDSQADLLPGETYSETQPPDPPVSSVPQEVGKAQGLIAAYDAGVYDGLMAWVSADPRRKIAFDAITKFERSSPLLEEGRVALGMTPAQLDALFVAADQAVI